MEENTSSTPAVKIESPVTPCPELQRSRSDPFNWQVLRRPPHKILNGAAASKWWLISPDTEMCHHMAILQSCCMSRGTPTRSTPSNLTSRN
ncbi:unnamed protein product [Arctogadus glacialis]